MTARSNNLKRGASKSKSAGKDSSRTHWVWLLAGLMIGVFIAFLAGLTPSVKDVRSLADQASTTAQSEPKKEHQPVFDFYTLLPETEATVVAPERTPAKEVAKTSPPVLSESAKKYLLQAGSFRSYKDAEHLRAKLLLEGLSPRIEKVSVGGGEIWHRVQLGPFSDSDSMNKARRVLVSQNIDSLLLQLK